MSFNFLMIPAQKANEFVSFPKLKTVTFTRLINVTSDIAALNAQIMPSLQRLTIERCEKLKLAPLDGLPISIKHLNLSKTLKTDDELKQLSHLKQLRTLNLSHCKITGTGFQTWFTIDNDLNLKYLRMLKLEWCKHITNQGLQFLSNQTTLNELYLMNCEHLTDASSLFHLKQLQVLYLRANIPAVGDAFCQQLSEHLPMINELVITYSNAITNTGVKHLSKLKTLEILHLNYNAHIDNKVRLPQHLCNILGHSSIGSA